MIWYKICASNYYYIVHEEFFTDFDIQFSCTISDGIKGNVQRQILGI